MPRTVDAMAGRGYTPQIRMSMRVILGCAALAASALAACAARVDAPPGPVARELETETIRATAPDTALRIIFDWTARERDARFSGRGVARVQAPYHARLDLFGPRGEAYLSAAVVNHELRLPASASPGAVPPAPLLWSVLGVVAPPPGAELVATRRDGETTTLEYRHDGGRWSFALERGRLRSAAWDRDDGRRFTVELRGEGAFALPERAEYRDWAAFTELVLTLDEVEAVDAFSPDTWVPPGS